MGRYPSHDIDNDDNEANPGAPLVVELALSPMALVVMVYISAKPRSVLLKQLVSLTRGMAGSPGSRNSMSTHCGVGGHILVHDNATDTAHASAGKGEGGGTYRK